jgi:hypothetical protein
MRLLTKVALALGSSATFIDIPQTIPLGCSGSLDEAVMHVAAGNQWKRAEMTRVLLTPGNARARRSCTHCAGERRRSELL